MNLEDLPPSGRFLHDSESFGKALDNLGESFKHQSRPDPSLKACSLGSFIKQLWRKLMKNFTKTSLISVVASSALAFMGLTAQANDSESLTKIVSYADLNLDSAAGAKVLYMRLRAAAQTVCHPLEGRAIREVSNYNACFEHALTAAVASINKPALSALYRPTFHATKG